MLQPEGFWKEIQVLWKATSDRICLNISVDMFPQVTEEMMDQANEKKMDAINAQGEGMV